MTGHQAKIIRQRLGLDTTQFGSLLGVHSADVVAWESKSFEDPFGGLQGNILRAVAEPIDLMSSATCRLLGDSVAFGLRVGGVHGLRELLEGCK